ncbi:MAG: tetratricopeptide repeat protein [Nitrospirae bacterium]|nr:tetratricopeptide repeat protein [Nitrospirota bacterium]MDA8215655.1 tetratricopeptide repeat protein [Nitrospiraceae bacterium]
MLPLFLMIFTLCHEASAEYGTNQTILQKIRYIDAKQEHVIKAAYIITEIKETRYIGEGVFSKKADGKFIVVRFKVHNKGSIAIPTNTLTDLMLIDGKKKRWDYSLGATGSMRLGTESFGRMEIAPDKGIEDVVVFEVPEDVRDYLILLPGGAKVSAPKKQENAKSEEPKSEGKKNIKIITNSATLRSRPSFGSQPVTWAVKGAVFDVISEITDSEGRKWYRVKTSDGREGWIKDKVVSLSSFKSEDNQDKVKKADAASLKAEEKVETRAEEKIKEKGVKEKTKRDGRQKEQASAKTVKNKSDKKSLQELLDAAGIFYREGKCKDFINANEKAIEIASRQNNIAVEGKLHYNVAECYARLNRYDEAQKHLDNAVNIAARLNDSELEILALIDKSRVLAAKGDKRSSAEIFKIASERANKEIFLNLAVKDDIKALVSLQIAHILFDMGEKDKAKERLEYALMVNHDFNLEKSIVSTLKSSDIEMHKEISDIDGRLDEAWASYERGDYKDMERISRDAADTAKRLGYKRGVFGGNYYLAMSFINIDEYDKAIDHALLAQEMSEKGNDETRLGMVYNLIGNIFKQKKAYEKALYYYNRYLDSVKKTGNREGEAVALNNIGNVLLDKGEYRAALKYYEDSLKISIEIGTVRHMIAQEYLSIGRALKKLSDYKNAEKSISIAMNIFKDLGNEGGEIVGLLEMADNYALQAEYASAIEILENNLSRAERFGMKQSFIDNLINNSEKNRDYLRAEKYKKAKID